MADPKQSVARRRASLKIDAALLLTAGVIAIAAQGCTRKPTEQPVEHTVRKVTPQVTPETPPGDTNADSRAKEEFERALTMKLERLDEEIRELQSRVGALTETAKAEWTDTMADVTAKRKAAETKLDEVRKSSAGAWEHLREGADRAWKELDQAVQKARKEF